MIKTSRFNLNILPIPLSIISTTLVIFCYYLLQVLDVIVHSDLYGYGLVFSYEWANQYWNITGSIRDFILLSFIIIIIAIVFNIIQVISSKNFIKSLSSILIIGRIFLVFFSLISLLRLDFIVNDFLYDFGLQFSYNWAGPYWNTLVLLFGLFLAVIMIDGISILILIAPDSRFYAGVKSFLRVNSLLFILGVVILYLSVSFNSSVLAFIGLGCVFWGAILLYVRSSKYVKEDLLLTATRSSLMTLRQLILELGYKGKGIYLPPKYLRDFESSKVFISKTEKIVLPSVEQIQNKDTNIINNPRGLLVTPPGFDLSKLFEDTLETNFTQKDLSFVMENIHTLIVEDLEIAQNIQMELENSLIHITIENSVYKNMGTLSSAIACILAKTSGNLVIIENRETSKKGQLINLRYLLFESPIS
ncbi:MAG: hypothetical protein ACW99L_10985 [Promethearchaeota archaeon]